MDLGKIVVLLVEDSQNVRITIRSMLSELGITQVFEAKDGQGAHDYFTMDPDGIDLVICDWNMPHRTGFEFLKDVRQARPALPFIMITGRADQKSVVDAVNNSVTAYIRKPFSFDDLKNKIHTIFKKR